MLNNIVVNIISSMLCSIVIVYTQNNIQSIGVNKNKAKYIIAVIAIAIITYLSARIEYNAESILFKITLYIITFKVIYRFSIYKTIISVFMTIALLSLGDLISTLLFVNFITVEQMRGIWYWIIICNISVCTITFLLNSIPYVRNKLRNFISNLNDEGKLSSFFLIVLSVVVIIYILYNISLNYQWSEKYIINIIIAVSYFIIIGVFLKDKSDYTSLMKQYDCLFEYFKEFEESIDDIALVNHEYKNQLSIIKSYIKNDNKKEVIKYINDITKDLNLEDKAVASELKFIPKGGIKGLLYYKIISARNKGIAIILDVSKECKTQLESLSYEINKTVSKILGVYIDNSIDAVSQFDNKTINIEIYTINNEIYIVISNPFEREKVNLSKVSKRGYSTKGREHGKGLYLINKMISKQNNIRNETKIINNYFIQKLIIKITSD